jgi:hypothetical protein
MHDVDLTVRDEHLQIQVPSSTKHDLAVKAAQAREPIRVLVLKALQAYGVEVPSEAIHDRRKGRR